MTVYEFMREELRELGLAWLHERCADVDGCLVWKLAAAHGVDPQARVGGKGGGTILVRRLLWELVNEREFPRDHIARCTCGTALCVHPDHVVAVAKTELQRGKSLPLAQRAHIAKAKRAKSRLSDAAVAFIRSSTGPLAEVAQEFGIDPTYVSNIRLGKVRIDYASPFSGLGARR